MPVPFVLGIVMQSVIQELYRSESRRVLASLIRLLGDFDLAEEALHEAFAAALVQWPNEGMPAQPRAWLVSTGRFKAIDQLRKRARFDASHDALIQHLTLQADEPESYDIEDDRLRLIFICCHPGLSQQAQIALTLREVCDLTTEEIARAFLIPAPTLAQRIVRAKAKIRDAKIPFEVPEGEQLAVRLQAVLKVLYLVFNEGYAASEGEQMIRHDLAGEAIRLARLLYALLPEPEVLGLLSLMLLQDSRRDARVSAEGELVILEEQDRSRWDQAQIREGCAGVLTALGSQRFGVYTLQAAIAAVHAEAPSAAQTDWAQIVGLYEALLRLQPSPVIALNRAVAVAMRDGPEAGLQEIDALLSEKVLADYHLAHAARADMCRRLGLTDKARQSYQQALDRATQGAERRFLARRLAELS